MYIDLRTKLEMYKNSQLTKEKEIKITGPEIQEILEGTVCSNEFGSFYLIETKYPLSYIHGAYPLGKAFQLSTSSFILSDSRESLNLNEVIFLDTETTGLSGGTGTVAFLIGVGYFTVDYFVLQQYFMRDYNEEAALLKALNIIFSSNKIVVTYNGKAFDWNLLQTRYTSNRLRIGLKTPTHIDLLYPSRILWRQKLENCKLSSIEENILKINRIDDIPGALIPSVYFKYLDDRNATEIKKVITHNETDILSLVSLMIRMNLLLTNPLAEAKDSSELFGIGRIFEKREQFPLAIACYSKCTTTVNLPIKELALKRLAFLYKRTKEYVKAIECLENILNFSKAPNILVKIELAKHYEHRLLDPEKAIKIVHPIMEFCLKTSLFRDVYYEDLKVRLDRLKKKSSKAL